MSSERPCWDECPGKTRKTHGWASLSHMCSHGQSPHHTPSAPSSLFPSPELGENKFLLFKPLGLWSLLWQLEPHGCLSFPPRAPRPGPAPEAQSGSLTRWCPPRQCLPVMGLGGHKGAGTGQCGQQWHPTLGAC